MRLHGLRGERKALMGRRTSSAGAGDIGNKGEAKFLSIYGQSARTLIRIPLRWSIGAGELVMVNGHFFSKGNGQEGWL